MTKDEIIEIANEAGIVVTGEAIYTLCKLVAQHEREACASLAEGRLIVDDNEHCRIGYFIAQHSIVKDIRARGQA